MPIFGSGIDIIVGSSGSGASGSYNGINFTYLNPNYGFGALSSSLGGIAFANLNNGNEGASGEFIVKLASNDTAATAGSTILRLGATGTTNSPIFSLGVPENTDNLGAFDLRTNKSASNDPSPSIILRTNEDGEIEEGETTGRIIFLIESGSAFGGDSGSRVPEEFLASASSAGIFSRVISSDPENGVVGSLVFQVNDDDSRTEPFNIMEMGYGVIPKHTNSLGILLSASLDIANSSSFLNINDENGYDLIQLGHDPSQPFSSGRIKINSVDVSESLFTNIEIHSSDNSYISNSYNLGIGTSTPQAKLEIIGDLLVSTDITASTISSSGNMFVKNKVGRRETNTFIDFNPTNTGEIDVVINSSSVLTFTTNSISASSPLTINASEGLGSDVILTYNTSSGDIFYTPTSGIVSGSGNTPLPSSPLTYKFGGTSPGNPPAGEFYLWNFGILDQIIISTESYNGVNIAPGGNYDNILYKDPESIYTLISTSSNAVFETNKIISTTFDTIDGNIVYNANAGYKIKEGLFTTGDVVEFRWDKSAPMSTIQPFINIDFTSNPIDLKFDVQNIYSQSSAGFDEVSLTGSIYAGAFISKSANLELNSITLASSASVAYLTSSGNIEAGEAYFTGVQAQGADSEISVDGRGMFGIGNYQLASTSSNTLIIGDNDVLTRINGDGAYLSTDLTASNNISASEYIYASGAILSPTSSGVPSFTGVDGQMVFGSVGSNHYIYVWMAGAWKSGSLS